MDNKIITYESLNIDPQMMSPEEFSEIFGEKFEEVEDSIAEDIGEYPEEEESEFQEVASKDEVIATPLLDLEAEEEE